MNSRIFLGRVMHARGRPTHNRFQYPLYVYSFDLAELAELDREVSLFGYNRFRPVSLHDGDYLARGPEPVRDKLDRLLRSQGVDAEIHRVHLVTGARYLNYVFNPVSFFHCFKADGTLAGVVAQVNNTFGEMHAYILWEPLEPRLGFLARYQTDKVFHVSPFFDRAGSYEFHFSDVRRKLDVLIHYRQGGRLVFAARLSGTPTCFTDRHLARTLLRHPVTASLTMPRILRQAATLHFGKKLPVYRKPTPASPLTIRTASPSWVQKWCRRAVFAVLDNVGMGQITVTLPDGWERSFGDPESGRREKIRVRSNDFFRRVVLAGEIGFGESYVAGDWETDDLPGLLKSLIRNWDALNDRKIPWASLGRARDYVNHLRRPNTTRGSRRNIREHYDLGNRFFQTFLDASMTYSSALFQTAEDSLEAAQDHKLESIIGKARIGPEDHVLEIGCGWGNFAVEAAKRTGCRVTAITVSEEQCKHARQRVADAGLEDRVRVELSDYRHVAGSFDKIVSIEMLEAVGHRYLGQFFAVCDGALKPHGLVVVQTNTIPDQRYSSYRRSSDWIRKHIFPGGHLPSLSALTRAVTRSSELIIEQVENIGVHYARTLAEWRKRLLAHRVALQAQGFDEKFLRKWEFYFAYCEAAFATRFLNNLQLVLTRPGNRALPGAPESLPENPGPSRKGGESRPIPGESEANSGTI